MLAEVLSALLLLATARADPPPGRRIFDRAFLGSSYAVLFDAARTPDPEAAGALWASAANASFTQYPRCCTSKPAFDPAKPLGAQCDGGAAVHRCTSTPKANFTFMGYSMRTDAYRYQQKSK